MLNRDKKLRFLRKKIGEISLAMFRAETDPLFQLPNNIITPLRTDDEGNVWFLTSYKGELKKMATDSFPACLEFYKKGIDGRLFANGQASIVRENDEAAEPGKILIRFRILHARYSKGRKQLYSSLKTKLGNFFRGIFSPAQFQEFDLQEAIVRN